MPTNPEVDEFLATLAHPLQEAIERLREIILASDARVGECIKWKSPTFTYRGNIASINPKSKKKVSLMFHQGASLPGKHPTLVGGGSTVKYMYFADKPEVDSQQSAVESAIQSWCDWKDS